jgi:hypothetical protein
VLGTEKKLSVKIRDVDGIEVNNFDILESGKYKVFENFATDAPCADDQNPRFRDYF